MTIDPQQDLPPEQDYALLRREVYAAVEALGHEQWTDYNAHDPGITLLEAFCYALAETGYRLSFDLADLLTQADGTLRSDQSFYPARQILTSAPLTNDDYRRLLIDATDVRNAWLICQAYDCTPPLFPECGESVVSFAPRWRTRLRRNPDADPPVRVEGVHEVLLQLATDSRFGDLNSDRLDTTVRYTPEDGAEFRLEIELRFPEWKAVSPRLYDRIVEATSDQAITDTTVERLRIVHDNPDPISDAGLLRNIDRPFFFDFRLSLPLPGGQTATVTLANVSLRLHVFRRDDRRRLTVAGVMEAVERTDLVAQYFARLRARRAAVAAARQLIRENRKLGEAFCRVDLVRPLDVGVCAELHLDGSADIESVLARFYREIERFLNPAVPFRTLEEMREAGFGAEEIFSGPPLNYGFITDEDLEATRLRSRVAVGDILDLIVDIPGIQRIEGLRFTTYDDYGAAGCAGREWSFRVPPGHYPILFLNGSSVTIFKDGLPFEPRHSELVMVLEQLRADDRPLPPGETLLDLPLPTGRYAGDPGYLPVQKTLPEVYGLGPGGVPAGADTRRLAQADQLAAYLHPLEKITAATAARVNDFADLFSSDATVNFGWADPKVSSDDPAGLRVETEALLDLDDAGLRALIRDEESADRQRGRVLDHMLARFAEGVQDYVALVHDVDTRRQFGETHLNDNKAALLAGLAESAGKRGTAPGLSRRLDDLLFTEGDGPLILEHVRLRPKFPGDALMAVCLGEDCRHYGREDAYSFRVTFVLNGDAELYNEDSGLRRYANRLIRRETPAHLLPKICWATEASVVNLDRLLAAWEALDEGFDWYERNLELRSGLQYRLGTEELQDGLLFLGYYGEAFLRTLTGTLSETPELETVDEEFFNSVREEFREDLTRIRSRDAALYARWGLADDGLPSELTGWLETHYAEFAPVSIALHRLVAALEDINSVYPVATLHDCDDGDNDNPVRLGTTSLGSFE